MCDEDRAFRNVFQICWRMDHDHHPAAHARRRPFAAGHENGIGNVRQLDFAGSLCRLLEVEGTRLQNVEAALTILAPLNILRGPEVQLQLTRQVASWLALPSSKESRCFSSVSRHGLDSPRPLI